MEWLHQSRRKFNTYLSELDDWATSAHLAQAYLLVANFFLSLKASANILAFLSNSSDLITDYNGLTLFSALFNRCFFLLNLMVFVSSMFCLLALMLTLKHNSLRLLLIHCFTFSQIALIVVIMILMACLWLSPMRVDLAENFPEWRDEIANYDYRLPKSSIRWSSIEGDELEDVYETLLNDHHLKQHQSIETLRNELLASENEPLGRSYVIEVQTFAKQVDMLQRSLGCCGIQDRNDWVTYNSEWQLVAPSCCQNPSALLVGRQQNSLTRNKTSSTNGVDGGGGGVAYGEKMNESSQISRSPRSRAGTAQELIYYCPFNNNNIIDADRLARRRGDAIIGALHGRGQLNDDALARGPGPHISRDELLELQLAIEWTGPPRSGNFVLNQAQKLQLSIVYGCQRTIDDRLASCLLGLRLRLLILISFLTLNVIARSAALESKPAARRNRSHHRHHHQNVHQGMVISAI